MIGRDGKDIVDYAFRRAFESPKGGGGQRPPEPKKEAPAKQVLLFWKERLKSIFLNGKKCRPQGGLPTASPAQRVAVGKEEQGSGRMASFVPQA